VIFYHLDRFFQFQKFDREGPEAGEANASPGGTPGKRYALPLAGLGEALRASPAEGLEPESVLVGSRLLQVLTRHLSTLALEVQRIQPGESLGEPLVLFGYDPASLGPQPAVVKRDPDLDLVHGGDALIQETEGAGEDGPVSPGFGG